MEASTTKPANTSIFKYLYAAFLIAGIIFVLQKHPGDAIIYFGLALAFDPFNQNVPFGKRPAWQKLWLTVHLAVTFVLIAIEFLN